MMLSILTMLTVIAIAVNQQIHLRRYDTQGVSPITSARADIPIIYAYGCDAWYVNAEVHPCMIGAPTARKTVVLLGDSIGAQWTSLIPEIFWLLNGAR